MTPAERTVPQRPFSESEARLLRQIKSAVHEAEPESEVILFGSRARGDASQESDWDLLVLLDGEVDAFRKDTVRRRLYQLTLTLPDCPSLSAIIHSTADWGSSLYRAMPFHARVDAEGVAL